MKTIIKIAIGVAAGLTIFAIATFMVLFGGLLAMKNGLSNKQPASSTTTESHYVMEPGSAHDAAEARTVSAPSNTRMGAPITPPTDSQPNK